MLVLSGGRFVFKEELEKITPKQLQQTVMHL